MRFVAALASVVAILIATGCGKAKPEPEVEEAIATAVAATLTAHTKATENQNASAPTTNAAPPLDNPDNKDGLILNPLAELNFDIDDFTIGWRVITEEHQGNPFEVPRQREQHRITLETTIDNPTKLLSNLVMHPDEDSATTEYLLSLEIAFKLFLKMYHNWSHGKESSESSCQLAGVPPVPSLGAVPKGLEAEGHRRGPGGYQRVDQPVGEAS